MKVKLGSHCDIRLKWLWENKQGSSGCFEGSKSEVESVHLHLSVIVNQYQFFKTIYIVEEVANRRPYNGPSFSPFSFQVSSAQTEKHG